MFANLSKSVENFSAHFQIYNWNISCNKLLHRSAKFFHRYTPGHQTTVRTSWAHSYKYKHYTNVLIKDLLSQVGRFFCDYTVCTTNVIQTIN